MINRILMELYDDYSKDNTASLIEFSEKTFPKDGTDVLFNTCTLILFSRANGLKPRYDCTRENLLSIVIAVKEKRDGENLLSIYMERINDKKGISKYYNKIKEDEKLEEHADIIIDYLEQFKPRFIEEINNKINKKA